VVQKLTELFPILTSTRYRFAKLRLATIATKHRDEHAGLAALN